MNDKTVDENANGAEAPTVTADIPADAAAAALADKPGQLKLVGYIIRPDVMAGLLDICEDIPGRHYKRLVPGLQSSAQLVEDEHGQMRIAEG